jgi:ribosomal protein L40E
MTWLGVTGVAVSVCRRCEWVGMSTTLRCRRCRSHLDQHLRPGDGTVVAATTTPGQRYLIVDIGDDLHVLAFADASSSLRAGDTVVVTSAEDGTNRVAATG